MRKLITCLGLVFMAAFAFSGCTLYFGGDDGGDSYTYCGADGQYECYGDECYWAGPTCDGDNNGYECVSDSECASGCYCGDGYCVEAGYCASDDECGFGFTCDEQRSSCVPADRCGDNADCPMGYFCDAAGTCQPLECDSNADCASACYCSESSGLCEESCYCANDTEATNQGFGFCDEARSTCMPGTDPDHGSCAGAVTCNTVAPTCPANEVPLIKDGCYTGLCEQLAACDVAPTCEVLNTESACLGRMDCFPEYNGQNCTTPGGTACTSGSSNCTCTTFTFDECNADAQP